MASNELQEDHDVRRRDTPIRQRDDRLLGARPVGRLYGALIEWPVPAGDGDYVSLDPPGGGTALTFQRVAGYVAPT